MKKRKDRICSEDFRTCKICNKILNNLTALSTHIFLKHHLKSRDYYEKYLKTENEGMCLMCGKQTKYRHYCFNRFCSNRCADNYNYKNEEYRKTHKALYNETVKNKISDSIKEYFKDDENRKKLSKTIKNYFKIKENREKTANAVRKCINEGKLRKSYLYDNETFQSFYELSFYIWLKEHNVRFEYLHNHSIPYIFNGVSYNYFPDFRVYNTFVEIKGPHFFENGKMINPFDRSQDDKYEAKHQCMIKNNVKIITDCSKYIDYVENKYGKSFKREHINRKAG